VITVRATLLESFRLYWDPDCNFISTDEIEARLLGLETTPDAEALARMERGSAFHAAVERFDGHDPEDREVVREGDWTFATTTIHDARSGLTGAAEVEGSTTIDVDGVLVLLTGHADWLCGLQGWDLKTSGKAIPADRHAGSMQWRAYCLLFGLQRFTYRHVYLAADRHDVVYARSIDDVALYPYPRMRDDVVSCLRDLLAFAELRGCLDAMRLGRAA
jgi:hypothetical protein